MPNTRAMALVVSLLALVLASSCKSVAPEALPATQAWLALVDGGQYAQSWSEAASFFRGAVDSPTWEKQVAAVRGPLGKVQSRTVKSSTATTSVPNAPAGEYVIFQFETAFEHKPSAIETVTPMKDSDGTWRVSGYYVR
jgi:hypothetical protein